jgi:hypothetical protein
VDASTVPDWILRTPAIKANMVDLPTPSGPITPIIWRAGISTSIWSKAATAP